MKTLSFKMISFYITANYENCSSPQTLHTGNTSHLMNLILQCLLTYAHILTLKLIDQPLHIVLKGCFPPCLQ